MSAADVAAALSGHDAVLSARDHRGDATRPGTSPDRPFVVSRLEIPVR